MTSPHPLPAEGGSYIRLADGSLIPADQVDMVGTAAPDPAEATTPQKTGRKAPVKEA
ncbi:hypothetical protein Q9299_05155 [Gemmobacter fulvus]|uniref:hypothetical protein n=1 Tax=Gemmobacter fulvus TaxID=2840474 RepID=UPI002796C5D5|nr:hypothetical protein [Gemmobacter fulvus]MDQ1847670.1 hypothetical protein [Gemmobacter fulvus]